MVQEVQVQEVQEEQEQGQEQQDAEKGWSQVNGSGAGSSKKLPNGATGDATPALSSGKRTPSGRYGSKDNKVAYLLFYQKIGG